MEPTTRNRSLLIGGGIILVLLLLVCGPLEGRFGTKDAEQKTPDVAAGPPAGDLGAAAGVAVAGAAAGGAIGESGIAGIIEGRDASAGEVDGAYNDAADAASAGMAATGGAVSATGAAIASAAKTAGSSSGAGLGAAAGSAGAVGAAAVGAGAASAPRGAMRGSLPPVSAGGPAVPLSTVTVAAAPSGPSPAETAAAAASQFDQAVAGVASAGIGAAGPVVDRFAPPVESGPGNSRMGLTPADAFGGAPLRPCDSPGAGCQNVSSVTTTAINPAFGSLGGRGARGGSTNVAE